MNKNTADEEFMAKEYLAWKKHKGDQIIYSSEAFMSGYRIAIAHTNNTAEPVADGWISVKEKLPELEKSVFLTDGKHVLTGMYGKYDHQPIGTGEKWVSGVIGFCGYNLGIEGDPGKFDATHWMLLPNPPSSPIEQADAQKET